MKTTDARIARSVCSTSHSRLNAEEWVSNGRQQATDLSGLVSEFVPEPDEGCALVALRRLLVDALDPVPVPIEYIEREGRKRWQCTDKTAHRLAASRLTADPADLVRVSQHVRGGLRLCLVPDRNSVLSRIEFVGGGLRPVEFVPTSVSLGVGPGRRRLDEELVADLPRRRTSDVGRAVREVV